MENKDHIAEGITSFRTKELANFTIKQSKLALSNTDDKRVWNGLSSLAYGHYKLGEELWSGGHLIFIMFANSKRMNDEKMIMDVSLKYGGENENISNISGPRKWNKYTEKYWNTVNFCWED